MDPFHCLVQSHHSLESSRAKHSDFRAPVSPSVVMEGKTCLCQPCVPVGSETSACLVFLESSSRAAPLQGSWPGWGRPQGRWHCVPGPFVTVGTVGRNVAVCHRALCNTAGWVLVATVSRGGNGTGWCCKEALCSHLVPCCPQTLTIFFPCALRDRSRWDRGETLQHGLEKKEDAEPDIPLTTRPTLTSHPLRAWQT